MELGSNVKAHPHESESDPRTHEPKYQRSIVENERINNNQVIN